MRKYWIIAFALVASVVFINQWRMHRELESLMAAERAAAGSSAPDPNGVGRQLRDTQFALDQTRLDLAAANRQIADLTARVRNLEKRLDELSSNASQRAEADSTDPIASAASGPPKGRRWGPEQATGAPDTSAAGDYATAWAPLQPNGGLEWLKLDYQNAVNVAEIHIRETYNPGAVYKITALAANGAEIPLWEGTESAGAAPFESVFNFTSQVYAQSIKIYLDTSRVPSWSEIDAVELVGRDGSRQWASGASASSTYASQFANDGGLELTPEGR